MENHHVISFPEFVTGFITMCKDLVAVTKDLKAQLKVERIWFGSQRFQRTMAHCSREACC